MKRGKSVFLRSYKHSVGTTKNGALVSGSQVNGPLSVFSPFGTTVDTGVGKLSSFFQECPPLPRSMLC